MRPRSPYRRALDGTLFRKTEERATDYGGKAERKMHHGESQAAVDFCLSCTAKKCNGNCDVLKRFMRDNGLTGKWRSGAEAKRYPYKGAEYTARELSQMCGLHIETIRGRIRKGMTAEEAVELGNQHSHYKRIGRKHKCKE